MFPVFKVRELDFMKIESSGKKMRARLQAAEPVAREFMAPPHAVRFSKAQGTSETASLSLAGAAAARSAPTPGQKLGSRTPEKCLFPHLSHMRLPSSVDPVLLACVSLGGYGVDVR